MTDYLSARNSFFDRSSGKPRNSYSGKARKMGNDAPDLQLAIAKRLRALQKVAGATDQQMANYVGISKSAWTNSVALLSDKRNKPSEEAMIRLCNNSGLTMEWIYRGDFEKVPYSLAIALQQEISGERSGSAEKIDLPGFVEAQK